jgi:uncharacterized protein (DUF433 family)
MTSRRLIKEQIKTASAEVAKALQWILDYRPSGELTLAVVVTGMCGDTQAIGVRCNQGGASFYPASVPLIWDHIKRNRVELNNARAKFREEYREKKFRLQRELRAHEAAAAAVEELFNEALFVKPEPVAEEPKVLPTLSDRWTDRLEFDPAVSPTSPTIKGTWVTVEQVVKLVVDGWTWTDILKAHPELVEGDIRTCLSYTIVTEAA